jgi:hypothetical protein
MVAIKMVDFVESSRKAGIEFVPVPAGLRVVV